jgi:hypothetical protein
MNDKARVIVKQGSGGLGLTNVLFIVFLVLKLTGHIDWSWWWVTAPLWGVVALILTALTVVVLYMVLWELVSTLMKKK